MKSQFDSSIFNNASEDVANYARLLCLIVEQGTDRMRHYVYKNLPNGAATIDEALAMKKCHFQTLKKNKVINAKQFRVLYPAQLPIVVGNLDLSLLYVLCRNLADNLPYVKFLEFEKNGPRVIDTLPQHDIIRIRNMRNTLFHVGSPEVENGTFELMWPEISLALRRLGTTQETIDEYRLKDLDPMTTLSHYVNFREQIHDEYESLYKGEIRKRKHFLVVVVIVALILIFVAMILSYIMYKFTGTWSSCIHNMQLRYSTSQLSEAISFMPRNGWHAHKPIGPRLDAHYPVDYVIVSHSAVSGHCMSTDDCCNMAQIVQQISFHRNLTDVAFNYLIGNDGVIYEGREIGIQPATAHGWNNISIGIGFMGTYMHEAPTDDALYATEGFLQYLVDYKYLTRNFTIYGMCQVRPGFENAPGAALYNVIKHWHGYGKNNPWSWREYPGGYTCYNSTYNS